MIWRDWRTPASGEPLGEMRFDAVMYDREVARAEEDHAWAWPARTLARLIDEQLRADPTILGHWECAPGWCTAWLKEIDTARLTFLYPATADKVEDPHLQFGLVIDVRDQDPEALAAELIESLRTTDPKSVAEMIGGSRDGAEKLGLVRRPPARWKEPARKLSWTYAADLPGWSGRSVCLHRP